MLVNIFNQDIVPSVCMISPNRRNHGHPNIRTSITSRSCAASRIGPPRLRHLSRSGAQPSLVEQMVARISDSSRDRLCRSFAGAISLPNADYYRNRAGDRHHAASTGRSGYSRNALRFDRGEIDSRQTRTTRYQAAAERGDDSTGVGQVLFDAPAGSQSRECLLPLADGLGDQCHLRHRHHHQAFAWWEGNRELPHHRSLFARHFPLPASGQEQPNGARASAAELGAVGPALRSSVRQRECLQWRAYSSARARSDSALLFVLPGRAFLYADLRSQAQPQDRDVSQSLGGRFLVALRVQQLCRSAQRVAALLALVSERVSSSKIGGQNGGASAAWFSPACVECALVETDSRWALAALCWAGSYHAQSRSPRYGHFP